MNKPLDELLQLLDLLRNSPQSCPWTKEQTFASLAPQTLEEAYELVDAIENGDIQEIKGELADLLYHVLFYAQIAKEKSLFSLEDIAQTVFDKHRRRLPDPAIRQQISAAEVNRYWHHSKAKQNPTDSILNGVVPILPALTQALKLQQRAARVGFDWADISAVFAKIAEEIAELQQEIAQGGTAEKLQDELGDVLFCCVNLARHLMIDPETSLRQAAKKFIQRFQAIEKYLQAEKKQFEELSPTELEELWQKAKDHIGHSNSE